MLFPRFRYLLLVYASVVLVSSITRCVLYVISSADIESSASVVAGIFGIGFIFDVVSASYIALPLLVYVWLIPDRLYRTRWNAGVRIVLYGILIFLLLFNSVSEYMFWDEFKTRYNFIAVDYLIYTTEVLGNIQESYPVGLIIGTVALFTILFAMVPGNVMKDNGANPKLAARTPVFLSLACLPVITFYFCNSSFSEFSPNTFANDLGKNGLYELFSAYRNNSLDYYKFYPVVDDKVAFQAVQNEIAVEYNSKVDEDLSIHYKVEDDEPERRLNVVLISVESLSSDFVSSFGGKKQMTPGLDSLSALSLRFSNVLATGTRTVRGLEALSLSVPPTPGQSIVRRPGNENLFSLGSVFAERGYACKYIYGGYSYFDNMNYFFSNNGYNVVDRNVLSPDEIDYENIWGVADENLFTLALREIDRVNEKGQPVFAHIMTTSNHRPFTYPDHRIDIPSHTGREGAVKYTDYAINDFLKQARKRKWFDDTMFIITADHCASSAGKRELPIEKYKIPLIVFCPKYVEPSSQERLMSQIDIAPTVLGLLNFDYESKFFGYDALRVKPGHERAFISTYQLLGFIEHDTLVILSPLHTPQIRVLGKEGVEETVASDHPERLHVVTDAISWYQTASYAFSHGKMKQ